MSKLKFKNIIFYLIFVLVLSTLFFTPHLGSLDTVQSSASSNYTKSKPTAKSDGAIEAMYTDEENMGNIPFSLYTSFTSGTGFIITDYYPVFNTSVLNEGTTSIYTYTIEESSRPYIMLCSDTNKDPALFNTTLYFKFNDQEFKTDDMYTIPSGEAGFVDVDAKLNGNLLYIETDTSNATTDDASIIFAVNLKPTLTEGAKIPTLTDGTKVDNTFDRTGLYTFRIRYSYLDNISNISNECIFEISFYVLDYFSYVQNSDPLSFQNTDTYQISEGVDTNYQIYNYNKLGGAPIVNLDATKFALNFVYTTGYTNYAMLYNTFTYNTGCYPNNIQNVANGTHTGTILLKLKDTNLTYPVKTYKFDNSLPYYAEFDLKDFEINFLKKYNINSSFLGEYAFNLDFLVRDGETYSIIDNSLFDIPHSQVTDQMLLLFGYNVKYYDQDPNSETYGQYLELVNENTHTTFISYNYNGTNAILSSSFYSKIPNYIAITNQAPLRFDYYGNLTKAGYTATFASIPYSNENAEQKVLDIFNAFDTTQISSSQVNNTAGIEPILLNSTYIQGSSISNDGIRVMNLEYGINTTVKYKKEDGEYVTQSVLIKGCQYVVFEINNTTQNLYIQSVNYNENKTDVDYTYDFEQYTNKDVRVNIKVEPNTFLTPVEVSYNYYPSYNTTGNYTSGILTTKTITKLQGSTSITEDYKYKISDSVYNYFVMNNNNLYTFSNSGTYRVTIKNILTNTPISYYFTIDKDNFTGVELHEVSMNGTYHVLDKTITTSLYNGETSKLLSTNLVVTGGSFTLGWDNKKSGAKSYSLVYYLEANENTDLKNSLFDINTSESWLTNGQVISNPSGAISSFKNYKSIDYSRGLNSNSYFNKDGLYIFYVYDIAGNFFTRTVLIDSSMNTILQGYWEDSTWVNTYKPNENPANYVNTDTTIYFGTHKALMLPDLSDTTEQSAKASLEDKSFTRRYGYNNLTKNFELTTKPLIEFNLYSDILIKYTNYIKESTKSPTITETSFADFSNYFLTLKNTKVTYSREYEEGEDSTGAPITHKVEGLISEISSAKIYVNNDTSSYGFNGEAQYYFIVTNENSKQALKDICMNFDVIQGTFWAYGDSNGDITERLIRKNTGTNLNVLMFTYNKLNDEEQTAQYYKVKSLTYDYYEFIVDDSNSKSSISSYPFTNSITQTGDLLSTRMEKGNQYIIDSININASGLTNPGKYILTRTYVGGTHNYIGTDGDLTNENNFREVGTGGKYYKHTNDNGDVVFVNLFEYDTITRKYVVYVDHNGIISKTFMIREKPILDKNDNEIKVREVGDNISLTLSNTYDDEWTFKEFFLTSSSTLALNTNKVPVRVNIPLSKYFAYYYSNTNNLYAKQSFANLQVKISYAKDNYSAWEHFIIDGYDANTGYCTCSALTSTNGDLIFVKAGIYKITINDYTGYTDTSSFDVNANNLFPTTFIYEFNISHTNPEAQINTVTYNSTEKEFEQKTLTNEDNSNNFATNIKEKNSVDSSITDNEVLINFIDPITPYQAKINQINLNVIKKDENINESLKIDLKSINLFETASSTDNLAILSLNSFKYLKYMKIYFYTSSSPSIYDQKEYYRYSYSLSVDISKEFVYSIELSYVSESSTNQHYVDENGVSFADSLYKLTIDRTKPTINIDNLLNEESYLTSSDYYSAETLNNFKEEKFDISYIEKTPSAFTYTFGVADNYTLAYNQNDTMSYFYVRNYGKYNTSYSSITPDMVDTVFDSNKAYYTNFSAFSVNYPRFAEINLNSNYISIGGETWYKVYYKDKTPLKSLIATATNNQNTSGFYEIIEKDYAGNFRCYTIYFNEYENIYQNLEIDGYTQKDNVVYLISNGDDSNEDNISANIFFELTKLSTHLGWGTISISNTTTNVAYSQKINITPYDNYNDVQDLLADINDFLTCELNSKFTFTLSKYNATYSSTALTRHINLDIDGEGKLDKPEIETIINPSTGAESYNLILPNYDAKRVLYLENFTLQKLENNVWNIVTQYIGKENVKNKIEDISKGIYKAIYDDNFNDESYYYILYVGEYYINDFNKEYQFEYNSYLYDEATNTYYSGGDIYITYESKIYNVYVSDGINEILISGDDSLESDSPSLQNCKIFSLSATNIYDKIPANQIVGGIDYYRVRYLDVTDGSEQKIYYFAIFNQLPQILLTNSFGSEITSTLEESDSQIASSTITISWESLDFAPIPTLEDNATNNLLSGILFIRNDSGEYRNGITIQKGQVITEEGYYKLQLRNNILGNYREIYFAISFSDIPLYTITANGEKLLSSNSLGFEKLDLVSTGLVDTFYNLLPSISGLTNNEITSLQNQLRYDATTHVSVGICELNNINHFYTVYDPSITYNNNIQLNIIEFCFNNNDLQKAYKVIERNENGLGSNFLNQSVASDSTYLTSIFLVYNLDGPIKVEFFALTRVPKKTSLLGVTIAYQNNKNTSSYINLTTNPIETTLTNTNVLNSNVRLTWNALQYGLNQANISWYNKGNVILLEDIYGYSTDIDKLACKYANNTNELTATISGSGTHILSFKDLAGNVHQFTNGYATQSTYKIVLIDSVIYHINYNDKDYNPIQYGTFNDRLTMIIDEEYLTSYHNLSVVVTRNGNAYYDYIEEENVYLFDESGRYTITLTALYGSQKTALNNAIYNFTIIDSNSARLAYEFVEIAGYEILEVTRNGQDITNNFRNEDGKVLSIFLSATSASSGNGYYSIKLRYGSRPSEVLSYSFTINDYIPTISCNIPHGETTTGSIILTYNPSVIYEQLGDCYIKILTYNSDSKSFYNYSTLSIDAESFTNTSSASFEITRSNSYFIQVETKSGNVLSSFRVNKTDPLNTMAIIIIVIAVIAVIVLIIIIIKLRTRMKVR